MDTDFLVPSAVDWQPESFVLEAYESADDKCEAKLVDIMKWVNQPPAMYFLKKIEKVRKYLYTYIYIRNLTPIDTEPMELI